MLPTRSWLLTGISLQNDLLLVPLLMGRRTLRLSAFSRALRRNDDLGTTKRAYSAATGLERLHIQFMSVGAEKTNSHRFVQCLLSSATRVVHKQNQHRSPRLAGVFPDSQRTVFPTGTCGPFAKRLQPPYWGNRFRPVRYQIYYTLSRRPVKRNLPVHEFLKRSEIDVGLPPRFCYSYRNRSRGLSPPAGKGTGPCFRLSFSPAITAVGRKMDQSPACP